MKYFLIKLFLSMSMFFVIASFYRTANNLPQLTFSTILTECKNASIGFDIENDIKELTTSMKDLNTESGFGGSDIFSKVGAIAKTIYYAVRFFVKMVFHSLIATLNVMIVILRCIGINMSYIHISPSTNMPFAWSGAFPPIMP